MRRRRKRRKVMITINERKGRELGIAGDEIDHEVMARPRFQVDHKGRSIWQFDELGAFIVHGYEDQFFDALRYYNISHCISYLGGYNDREVDPFYANH